MHRRTDAELLELARGDGAACGELYDRYERPVLVFLLRRTGDPELAADLTAEVFATVLARADGYGVGAGEPVVAWLLDIARDVHDAGERRGTPEDAARRAIDLPRVPLGDPAVRRLERLLAEQTVRDADGQLEDLPPDQADAIRRHDLDESELRDARGATTVRQRLSRGLGTLRNRSEHS